MTKKQVVQTWQLENRSVIRRLASAIFRLGRKSQTFRAVINVGMGGPSWSKKDIRTFVREGFEGNPNLYAACTAIIQGMAEPPPILYRVRSGSKIERAFKAEYDVYKALKGFSAKPYSMATAARQAIARKTSQMMLISGAPPAVARRLAVKQLAIDNEIVEITSHPILDLLSRPNGWYQTSYSEFVHAWGLSMLLAGEIFTEPKNTRGEMNAPDELYVLPAHDMYPDRGTEQSPIPRWRYRGYGSVEFEYSPDPTETEIYFNKLYDPMNPLRGLSPIESAVRSIDLNNRARQWNLNFLNNAGIPPGLVTGEFDPAQASAIEEEYEEQIGGPDNAGKLITLAGKNLQYHQLSMDAAKLMWGDVINLTAREISIVLGVPPEILGDSSNKTFSNYQEARLALYQDTILPRTDFMFDSWNSTWVRRFGDDLILDYDADQIVAIAADIKTAYERVKGADFLMLDEKRAAVGYQPLPNEMGQVIFVPLTMVPLDIAIANDTEGMKAHFEMLKDLLEAQGVGVREISLNGNGQKQ